MIILGSLILSSFIRHHCTSLSSPWQLLVIKLWISYSTQFFSLSVSIFYIHKMCSYPNILGHFLSAGYGDIHAVNVREMIFVMIYVSFDMILGAYLIGNMTALIVKGSRTERFRDKMKEVIRYMNRNKLGKDIREQIKGHLRLQYESSYTEASVLRDIPISIRAKVMSCVLAPFHPSLYSVLRIFF